MKIFCNEVSFLRELVDSASVDVFKSRYDVFLRQFSISSVPDLEGTREHWVKFVALHYVSGLGT